MSKINLILTALVLAAAAVGAWGIYRKNKETGKLPALKLSLLINAAVMLVMLLTTLPGFEANDDQVMANMINGAKLSGDPHLVFENILIGAVLKVLYGLTPALPWYTMLQYAVIFASLTAVTWVFLKRFQTAAGCCLSGLFLVYLGYECYTRVQFTKTAGIGACAGVLLAAVWLTWYRKKRVLAAAAVLFLCGFCYRFREAGACAVLMTGIGIPILRDILLSDPADAAGAGPALPKGKHRKKELGRIAVMFLALLLPCGAAYGINKAAYRLDAGWKDFFSYNNARKDIMDFGMPSYEENEEALNAMGIDETAYQMLNSWNFADPEVFSREVLTQIGTLKPRTEFFNKINLINFLKAFPRSFLGERIFFLFMTLAFLWLAAGRHRFCGWLTVFYEAFLFGVLYYYFYIQGRYLINRVDLPLFVAMGLVLVWIMPLPAREGGPGEKEVPPGGSRKEKAPERAAGREPEKAAGKASGRTSGKAAGWHAGMICLAGAVFFALMVLHEGSSFSPIWRWTQEAKDTADGRAAARAKLTELSARDDRLYLVMLGAVSDTASYGPLDTPGPGVISHIVWLGGWETYTKGYFDILRAYGVSNPFRDMIDNDRIRVAAQNTDLLLAYLHEHYDKSVQAVQEDSVGDAGIYKIVSSGPQEGA